MIRISQLANSVKPSATIAAGTKARQLKAAGIKVLDFSLGEPDFNTPEHICAAAEKAAAGGNTHYTPTAGTAEVKAAICKWYKSFHGLECAPENVIVSNGAKHSIHNALAATVGPGDEVIIPTPYWVSYSDLVSMTGATPVLVNSTPESGFKMSPEQLRAHTTPRTRMLMLNSPCNPTGTVYSRAELEALVDALSNTDAAILSDEIYEQLTYGDAKPTCVATLRPWLKDRTITISGASKSYAMTGWRMGWAVAPVAVVKAMDTIQSQETSCPSSVSQAALVAALTGPQDCVTEMRTEFAARRELTLGLLKQIPDVKLPAPEGAFYAFFDVSAYFKKTFSGTAVADSLSFCATLLEQAHVNLVPGSAFGAEGFVRMSFATNRETIEAGLSKLKQWLATAK
ncbi:Aspartate aminotransferase [Gemmata obscuriglobus]|uniref:Aminotransferase n=1 Tax=Gemmata obscuriglobus TaxID=114 RepID=A0A2Z3GV58_9BACT|nr:pyridoxal phosphate-dependent aminotransferase [Gemmata obscuriglobus]AWM37178.1 pyridoxal phosphate-dependent aminotransferase [Gemmata obscuriglobus]QEG30088.1 Aspartate aminotransferase [Gemmata obscuriglobus]VTS09409.1 aspartate aminotransferase : Aspartate aminotransferase OS=uncultured planctomycete GN=HGMM_F11G08C24 PE=3 SV=1: Aminotran_1_2 [Gemmata obscuriglobus UQM 2246]